MAMEFDLARFASRLQAAAERVAASSGALRAEVTPTDLIVAHHGADGGHGQGRTESLAFGVLFHDDEDRLAQALDRLERQIKDEAGTAG